MEKLVKAHSIPNENVPKHLHSLYEREFNAETWKSQTYTVKVYRHQPCPVLDPDGKETFITWLSIKRNDRMAKPDWRDFQWIKNQLVGAENEGCEIYPAESRLVDGANQYHLWVFEDPRIKFPFGFFEGRVINENPVVGETQRKFAEHVRPHDLAESEERIRKSINNLT